MGIDPKSGFQFFFECCFVSASASVTVSVAVIVSVSICVIASATQAQPIRRNSGALIPTTELLLEPMGSDSSRSVWTQLKQTSISRSGGRKLRLLNVL